jgi:DNA polymerase (family 10)
MLNIKGIGPKKIAVIWKEMGLETIGELLYACNENRLLLFKGFGEKTQQNVKTSLEFYLRSKGSYLYAEIEPYALQLHQQLQKQFPNHRFEHTGAFARQSETIDMLEWVSTAGNSELEHFFAAYSFSVTEKNEAGIRFKTESNIAIAFYTAGAENFGSVLFHTSCAGPFLNEWEKRFPALPTYGSEEDIFKSAGIPYILPCLREKEMIIAAAMDRPLPELIRPEDIKGVIHSHSNWSDGRQSVEDMANAAI